MSSVWHSADRTASSDMLWLSPNALWPSFWPSKWQHDSPSEPLGFSASDVGWTVSPAAPSNVPVALCCVCSGETPSRSGRAVRASDSSPITV
ncbi:MAG: hypothetical protein MI923_05700 [Phycisphaerales bacterium]|nr:hypothetical protein [Phycisphaerales bacterium]